MKNLAKHNIRHNFQKNDKMNRRKQTSSLRINFQEKGTHNKFLGKQQCAVFDA